MLLRNPVCDRTSDMERREKELMMGIKMGRILGGGHGETGKMA